MASVVRDALLQGLLSTGPGGSVLQGVDQAIQRKGSQLLNVQREQQIGAFPETQERVAAQEERLQEAHDLKIGGIKDAQELKDIGDISHAFKAVGDRDTFLDLHRRGLSGVTLDEDDLALFQQGTNEELISFADRNIASLDRLKTRQFKSASLREFEELTKGMTPEERQEAIDIRLGRKPRAVAAAPRFVADLGAVIDPTTATGERVTVEGEVQTPELIAQRQAEAAEEKKFGADVGAGRAKIIKDSFDTIRNAEKSAKSLDRVKSELAKPGGASTGFIQSFFPSFRAATVRLNSAVKAAGLDVVAGTTFGALSEGELKLALDVAIPTDLSPENLFDWVERKQSAQRELIGYLENQIAFIEGGGTLSEWRQELKAAQQDRQEDLTTLSNEDILARLRQ